MAGEVAVRSAGAGDMHAAAPLVAEMLAFYETPTPLGEADFAEKLESDGPAGAGHFRCLLAESEGETVGLAMYSLVYEAGVAAPCVFLRDIFVTERARRAGIGRRLMVELARAAQAEGWPRIDWHADRLDFDARTFYDLLCPDSFKINRLSYRIEGQEIAALAAKG